jgi:hypothetical protein
MVTLRRRGSTPQVRLWLQQHLMSTSGKTLFCLHLEYALTGLTTAWSFVAPLVPLLFAAHALNGAAVHSVWKPAGMLSETVHAPTGSAHFNTLFGPRDAFSQVVPPVASQHANCPKFRVLSAESLVCPLSSALFPSPYQHPPPLSEHASVWSPFLLWRLALRDGWYCLDGMGYMPSTGMHVLLATLNQHCGLVLSHFAIALIETNLCIG